VGAVVGTSVRWLSSVITLKPQSKPSTAVMIGSPIATAEPKTSSRMITAARIPILSLLPESAFDSSCPM
jgi:hypothetical protein